MFLRNILMYLKLRRPGINRYWLNRTTDTPDPIQNKYVELKLARCSRTTETWKTLIRKHNFVSNHLFPPHLEVQPKVNWNWIDMNEQCSLRGYFYISHWQKRRGHFTGSVTSCFEEVLRILHAKTWRDFVSE